MYLNKTMLIGNLTKDPEMKSLPSGIKVTSFGLATNRVWKDPSGEKKESTQFHNIVVFGNQAETVAKYLKKGSMAFIDGRLQTRSWDGQDGQKKYRTEIVAERVQFGPKGGSTGGAPAYAKSSSTKEESAPQELETIEYPAEDIKAEDIPF